MPIAAVDTSDPASPGSRPPLLRYAQMAGVAAFLVLSTCAGATEVRKQAVDRIAAGLAELLREKRETAYPALQALAAKRSDTYEPDDRFWPDLVHDALGRSDVRTALSDYVGRRYPEDAERLDRLTQELPELADAIVERATTQPPAKGGRPIPPEVMRRMREPGPAAQSALLAAALDSSNPQRSELTDQIVAVPHVTEAIRSEILALAGHASDADRDLAFRYAVAIGAEIGRPDVERALRAAPNGVVVRSALSWLVGRPAPERAGYAADLQRILDGTSRPEAWAVAVSLLAEADPARAREAIRARGTDAAFWAGEGGAALLAEATRRPPVLALLAEMGASLPVKDILKNGGCRVLPAILRLVTAGTSTTPENVTSAIGGTVVRIVTPGAGRTCDTVAMASALDDTVARALQFGVSGPDLLHAIEKAAPPGQRPVSIDAPEIAGLVGIFRAADRTRDALASDSSQLRATVEDPTGGIAPGVAGLVLSLPPDHSVLRDLRSALPPPDAAGLLDRLRLDGASIARTLRLTAHASGWSERELGTVVEIASQDASPDAARAAMEVLLRASGPRLLLEFVDRTIVASQGTDSPSSDRTLRAIRAMRRAADVAAEPATNFTPGRVRWLLAKLSDDGLRGRVVRALAPAASADQDSALIEMALARAVTARKGDGATGACLDISTLGPFTSTGPAMTLLGTWLSQAFKNEDWSAPCLSWLAPSQAGKLSEQGRYLVAMADERLDAMPGPRADGSSRTLAELWTLTERQGLGLSIRRRIATFEAAAADGSGWDLAAVKDLRAWDERLAPGFPEQAGTVRWEGRKRAAFLLAAAVPGALALHLAFWTLLLAAYPRSVRVQTHVFYNPLARKILGLGYVDLLLVWIGPIRRRLFEPFRASLSGEVDRIAPVGVAGSYYPRSGVTAVPRADLQRGIREAERLALAGAIAEDQRGILDALAGWRGPTCLFGPSGRGKTSYLRHALGSGATRRFPFVYLKASECRGDVLAAICAKLGGLGRDQDLVLSLVHAGLFDVYVDGLNEVEQDAQEAVVRFIVDHRSANVFVATQELGLSLPSNLATYYLLPLTRAQMKEFLASREPALEPSAPIRGAAFEAKASAFIDELTSTAEDSPPDGVEEGETARRKRDLAASFLATLANPLDLETASRLLALDIEPDPFRLQQQQFRLVEEDYLTRLGRPFPTRDFSRSVLEARRTGKAEVDTVAFGPVVAILEGRKQVRSVVVRLPGTAATTEYRFRHERILDFYTHFALLGEDPAERFALVRERPFEGVFEYLARELPPDEAAELKEYLLSDALDRNDHRLSDRFLQHLRWRSLLDREDPSWIVDFDLPAARAALDGFGDLSMRREAIETDMRARRAVVDEARRVTRILSAGDAETLEGAAVALFERMGATVEPTEGGLAPLLVSPEDVRFSLVCLAGDRVAGRLARIGAEARLEQLRGRKLLVLNPEPDADPRKRDWDRLSEWEEIIDPELAIVQTRRLQELFVRAEADGDRQRFWDALFARATQRRGTAATEPVT